MISDVILIRTAETHGLHPALAHTGWEQVQIVTNQKKPFLTTQSMMLKGKHAGKPEPTDYSSDTHWRGQVAVGKR